MFAFCAFCAFYVFYAFYACKIFSLKDKTAPIPSFILLLAIQMMQRISNIPRHPVILNNRTATENISGFLDFHLKNIVSTILHILRGTRDFLQRLNQIGDISENALLVSFDLVGLYSHISYNQGVKIMRRFLDKRENRSVSSESLFKLANIVLKRRT